jgi:hypothetical protein
MIADGSADRGSVTPTVAADTAAPGAPADAAAAGFVTRDGTSLSLDGAPFRFAGTNMYWLALDDNTPTVSYPTGFEIRDAMLTAKALGDTVVRAWADTVGCALCIEPTLGTFNASAFQSLDYAVFVAARLGLHLVLTLADNWAYYNGGKLTYTNWRGVGESAFFTDPTVIGDYESFISEVLNHVNPYTGVAYDQDPTIMAWETGNEVWCQTCGSSQDADEASWTTTISSYIKSLAPDQLVVDGLGVSPDCVSDCLNTAAMAAPDVDIVDDHFYPMLDARVDDASAEAASYGKAYMIGEYDWDGHDPGGDSLASFLSTVENSSTVGDLFWVLIPHDSTTGFQDHNDGFQFDFADSSPTMLADITALRDHAYVMAGTAVPPAPIAPQARMYPPTGPAGAIDVTWRGSFGAVSYTIESSDDGGATWTVAATGVTDGLDDAASPGWTDPDGTPTTLYRMTSVNLDGVTSGWTLPVGESAGS